MTEWMMQPAIIVEADTRHEAERKVKEMLESASIYYSILGQATKLRGSKQGEDES